MREFTCEKCGWSHTFDTGQALWEILAAAAREDEEEREKAKTKKPPG